MNHLESMNNEKSDEMEISSKPNGDDLTENKEMS